MTEHEITVGLPPIVIISRGDFSPSQSVTKDRHSIIEDEKNSEFIPVSRHSAETLPTLRISSTSDIKTKKIREKKAKSKTGKTGTILKVDLPVIASGCIPCRRVRYDENVPDMIKLGRAIDEKVYEDIVGGLNKDIDRTEHRHNVVRVMLVVMYVLIISIISLASRNISYTLRVTVPWFVVVTFLQEIVFFWLARQSTVSYIKDLNTILEKRNLVMKLRRRGLCTAPWAGATLGFVVTDQP